MHTVWKTLWNSINQTTLISKLEMVQQKLIHRICCNLKKDVSVTKFRHLLGMKTLETRRSVAQLKMFHNLIHNTKQVHKDILPACQPCSDIKFKPLLGVINAILQFCCREQTIWESATSLESHIYCKHAWRVVISSYNSREVFFVWQLLFFLKFKIFKYFFIISGPR